MGLLLLFVGFALGVSFLCSLLEASLLASRNATLVEHKQRGRRGSALLLQLKRTRLEDAISAILILNTLANTLGATLAGAQAARVFGSRWVGLFSGVLTFLILVVSEIIPKTLGAVYWAHLTSLLGWVLTGLTRAMTPALVLSGALTRMLTRGRKISFSRSELAAVIATATSDGAISAQERAMFDNLLRLNDVQVEDVMTPRTVVFMMPERATVDELLNASEGKAFSRVPLYRDHRDNVVGYVLLGDVLRAVAEAGDRNRPLRDFRREVVFIPELATLGAALRELLARRQHLAMVTDEHGGVAGLVTLEDVTETILGVEIVDESDEIPDLRLAAARLRDRRLERLAKRRELHLGDALQRPDR